MTGKMFGSTVANVVGMGVHHGIQIASWKMIVSLGSIFAFNMGALTFFDLERERIFYLFALMSLIGLTAVFIWRKMRKKAFIHSVIDLSRLIDNRDDETERGLIFRRSRELAVNLVLVSDPGDKPGMKRLGLVRPIKRSAAEYVRGGKRGNCVESGDNFPKLLEAVSLTAFGQEVEKRIFNQDAEETKQVVETKKGRAQ